MTVEWVRLDGRIFLVNYLNGFLECLYLAVALSGIFFVALNREWLRFVLVVFLVEQEEISLVTLPEEVTIAQVRP